MSRERDMRCLWVGTKYVEDTLPVRDLVQACRAGHPTGVCALWPCSLRARLLSVPMQALGRHVHIMSRYFCSWALLASWVGWDPKFSPCSAQVPCSKSRQLAPPLLCPSSATSPGRADAKPPSQRNASHPCSKCSSLLPPCVLSIISQFCRILPMITFSQPASPSPGGMKPSSSRAADAHAAVYANPSALVT